MSRKTKYSQELRDRAKAMAQAGASHGEISRALNIARGSVDFVLKNDLVEAKQAHDREQAGLKERAKEIALSGAWR